jgi:hypothetical protein
MSPRAQLEALTKGELLPDDSDRRKGGDVSDDDGSDSDSARDDKFELDPLAKVCMPMSFDSTVLRYVDFVLAGCGSKMAI